MSRHIEDFLKALKDDKDVVYSKPKEENIQIILPDKPKLKFKSKPIVIEEEEVPTEIELPTKQETKLTVDDVKSEALFKKSGTPLEKKSLWMSVYEDAAKSKKTTYDIELKRQGKFAITSDNEILLLPKNYEVVHKSVNEILTDKWL